MKEMVLLAGQRRRLLRAAVVGGIGSYSERSGPSGAGQVREQQQDVRPDTGLTSPDVLRAAKHGNRRG